MFFVIYLLTIFIMNFFGKSEAEDKYQIEKVPIESLKR